MLSRRESETDPDPSLSQREIALLESRRESAIAHATSLLSQPLYSKVQSWRERKGNELTEEEWQRAREEEGIHTSGPAPLPPLLARWDDAALPPSLRLSLASLGYKDPSPIQAQAIPALLARRDVLALAATGSGKSAAFLLPILADLLSHLDKRDDVHDHLDGSTTAQASAHTPEQLSGSNSPLALVLAPTRELATQLAVAADRLVGGRDIVIHSVIGGSTLAQHALAFGGGGSGRRVHLLVATPGKLVECLDADILLLDQLRWLVLDEADCMIEAGFADQLGSIMERVREGDPAPGATADGPRRRVTVLCSATLPSHLASLAASWLRSPVQIRVGNTDNAAVTVEQRLVWLASGEQEDQVDALVRLLTPVTGRTLVFAPTKADVNSLARALSSRVSPSPLAIHSGKTQPQREATLASFRRTSPSLLIATDVLGRGIDIPGVAHVVSVGLPPSLETWVHRCGRTGRAGEVGTATTIVWGSFERDRDRQVLADIVKAVRDSSGAVPVEISRVVREGERGRGEIV